MSNEADSFFGGGGTPWITFDTLNVEKGGRIVEAPKQQQMRDFDDNSKLLFWDEAKTQPRMELVVKVQTDERRDDVDGDTGIRAFHLSSKGHKDAARAALKDAGQGLRVGGELYMTWVAGGKKGPGVKKEDRAKVYTARYIPVDESAAFLAEPEAAAPASDTLTREPVPAAAPVAAAPVAPAAMPEAARQAMLNAGYDPATGQPLAK